MLKFFPPELRTSPAADFNKVSTTWGSNAFLRLPWASFTYPYGLSFSRFSKSFPYIKFCALGVSPELPNNFLPIPIVIDWVPHASPILPYLAPRFLNAVDLRIFGIIPPPAYPGTIPPAFILWLK